MLTNKELISNTGYWLDQIQNEIFNELKIYMDENHLNQKGLAEELGYSQSYISQVLNGNFNHSLGKLIDLSLAINKVPKISFEKIEDELERLNGINQTKTIDMFNYSMTVETDTIFNKCYDNV
ncbi:helix-turn-helix domain-containing protein [Maribacter sp. X9]|uniref:helix-turn-helix domain-containing protein n=1 Tax=Maribacter sp. X9 TaxID=3402159 RepID=UPI003AF3FAF0